MRRRGVPLLLAVIVAGAPWLTGCSEKVTRPDDSLLGRAPQTELTYAPLDSDTTSFRVQFYWYGYDRDGEVVRFRWAVDADTAKPINEWRATTAKDTTFVFQVDPVTAFLQHVFMIAAEDNDGLIDTTPARRFFTAKTLPPTSCIVRGPSAYNSLIGPNFTIESRGTDPDGSPIGLSAPVETFEYLLLKIGGLADSSDLVTHQPLPYFNQALYVDLINAATGDSLPAPYGDWKWIRTGGTVLEFRGVPAGEYVFAMRAVDAAGARERVLQFGCQIRRFTVVSRPDLPPPGLILSVWSSALIDGVLGAPAPIPIMEGETVSFSWIATAEYYGGTITGYTYALDDTSSYPPLDSLRTGVTLTPVELTAGVHTLYIRAVDNWDQAVTVPIRMHVIHPAFKDPGAPRQVLYVDDSLAPGNQMVRIGSFPSDAEETEWWASQLLATLGVPFAEWDTWIAGLAEGLLRRPPDLRTLADYSTVIWNVDFNNGLGDAATGLFKTLVGGPGSDLRAYLRAGGTLILSGFAVSGSTVRPNTTLYTNFQRGICYAFEPGTRDYLLSYFPRTLMGVDGALANDQGLRTLGARDFTAAWATAAGLGLGFDSALVDTGSLGSGAKWITYLGSGELNFSLSPGLPQVDGWVMAQPFACEPNPLVFRTENPSQPIAEVIYRYHGANMGIYQEGAPSPREGLVTGIRMQAYARADDVYGGGGVLVPGNAEGATGRMVHLSFPLYFLRDEDAARTLQAAFQYVNASPTLP